MDFCVFAHRYTLLLAPQRLLMIKFLLAEEKTLLLFYDKFSSNKIVMKKAFSCKFTHFEGSSEIYIISFQARKFNPTFFLINFNAKTCRKLTKSRRENLVDSKKFLVILKRIFEKLPKIYSELQNLSFNALSNSRQTKSFL